MVELTTVYLSKCSSAYYSIYAMLGPTRNADRAKKLIIRKYGYGYGGVMRKIGGDQMQIDLEKK
jgi:hypothetical protein